MNGEVKWFNPQKRFGFITREDGGKDVFVHESQASKAGLKLADKMKISFDIERDAKGRESAINLVQL